MRLGQQCTYVFDGIKGRFLDHVAIYTITQNDFLAGKNGTFGRYSPYTRQIGQNIPANLISEFFSIKLSGLDSVSQSFDIYLYQVLQFFIIKHRANFGFSS